MSDAPSTSTSSSSASRTGLLSASDSASLPISQSLTDSLTTMPDTTLSPSPSSSSPTPSSTPSTPPPPSGLGPPSSSLYLFTFLATLFLLLAISSAIIMRGIFLRRRFRRRLEEAIAAGVLLTPSDDGTGGFGAGRGPRRKLQRPTMFDVSVLPPYFSTSSPQVAAWENIMPFAGNISAEKPGEQPTAGTDSADSPPRRGHRPTARALLERAGYLLPRARLRRPNAPPPPHPASRSPSGEDPTTPAEIPLEPRDPVQRAAEVRVAVVIAMPHPHRSGYVPPAVDADLRSHSHSVTSAGGKGKARGLDGDGCGDGWGEEGEEEAGVPDVVLGTARVPVAVVEPLGEDAEESGRQG